jgi:hypothetical protein
MALRDADDSTKNFQIGFVVRGMKRFTPILPFPSYAIILSRIKSRSVRTVYTCMISHFMNFSQINLKTGMARNIKITMENIEMIFFIFTPSLNKTHPPIICYLTQQATY